MRRKAKAAVFIMAVLGGLATLAVITRTVQAHCDTESGPVAVAAPEALQTGQFEPIAIWVGPEQGPELRRKFRQALAAYKMGGAAKELAQDYFVSESIRLHRAAEGMSFTGVKPAQPLPSDIAAAEKALETGDVSLITEPLKAEVEKNVTRWFEQARRAREHKDESVEAGREYVDAYVKSVIYVHGLHGTIQAGPAHGVGEEH